jgi:hypothetical protein
MCEAEILWKSLNSLKYGAQREVASPLKNQGDPLSAKIPAKKNQQKTYF